MPNSFKIESISSLIQNLEISIKERPFEKGSDNYIEVIKKINDIELKISENFESGDISRKEAKILRKRIKRLVLPLRQYNYTETNIEKNNYETLINDRNENKNRNKIDAASTLEKTIKSPFIDFNKNLVKQENNKSSNTQKNTISEKTFKSPYIKFDKKSVNNSITNRHDQVIEPNPKFRSSENEKECISDYDVKSKNQDLEGEKLPEWDEIFSKIPYKIAKLIQQLFFDKLEFVDIFKHLFSSILWQMLLLRYSEAVDKGILLDNVESEMFTNDKRKVEYPIKALNIIKRKMKPPNIDISRMTSYKTLSNKRIEFVCRTYLFRHYTIIGVNANKIKDNIENILSQNINNITKSIPAIRDLINSAGYDTINSKDFREDKFPEIMHRLRNVESHIQPTWFKKENFFKDKFYEICLPSMKSAIIEWLFSERWFLELTIGKKIGQIDNFTYFSSYSSGGALIKIDSSNEVLTNNDDDEFVIDLKNMNVLFPYKNLESDKL
jgi:hypothetical protein